MYTYVDVYTCLNTYMYSFGLYNVHIINMSMCTHRGTANNMHVDMYLYQITCLYVCMYVCMYVSIYVCLYVCLYVCNVRMYMCVCMYLCMYVRMHA